MEPQHTPSDEATYLYGVERSTLMDPLPLCILLPHRSWDDPRRRAGLPVERGHGALLGLRASIKAAGRYVRSFLEERLDARDR